MRSLGLRLEVFNETHAADSRYLSWINDSFVMRYTGRASCDKPYDASSAFAYFEEMDRNEDVYFFAVFCNHNNQFIGTGKLQYKNEVEKFLGIMDLGLMIGERRFHGRGFGCELIVLLSSIGFADYNAAKISAGIWSCNYPALKSFNKVGFREEKRVCNCLVDNGEFFDHIYLKCSQSDLLMSNFLL